MMLMLWDIYSAERYGKRWNGRATSGHIIERKLNSVRREQKIK